MGKSQSKQPTSGPKDEKSNCVRFALVGSTGSGMSSFVNAVRCIDDEDECAASVDIVGTDRDPVEYTYPSNPLVSFCDLPGYGTPKYPDVETLWREHKLENFDRFFIFISLRVTEHDLELLKKIKASNKQFFLIRTNIDENVEYMMKKQKDQFKEEDFLLEIRNDILNRTSHLSCAKEDLFLVSNHHPRKWDFFPLIEAIINVMPEIEATDLTEQYMADVRMYIKQNGVANIQEFLTKKLEESKDLKIRFAITGNGGTGKSTFINSIRGIRDDDDDDDDDDNDGAAEVGVVETTMEPKEYKHPDNPKISFVDLPGIGTPNFPDLKTYCKKVSFEDYDTFLILADKRFTQNDLDLAEKVKSMGKSFFFVRTHIDEACNRTSVDESEILKKIREDCMKNLKGMISSEKEIFLISNYDKDKWDFDRLIVAISDALPMRQKECLTLSLSNVTRECLKRKAKILKAQAVVVASLAAGTSAIPIPVVGGFLNKALIKGTVMAYYKQLGLNNVTDEERALLDERIRSNIGEYQIGASVANASLTVAFGIEEVSKYIPFIGLAIASSVGFAVTLYYLLKCINKLEEDAIAVWDNAAKRSVQDDPGTSATHSSTQ